ncbi:NADH-dependent phenylglyoxylate dehydrogenase subunit epsilon [Pelotomaculum schinkii]|uniref:NADH-dependent phenylglyoxylate dehydrogenase subunit epsilon n=1 Tax=Pelotomaculum schinkii TaxID=78350 RepID=A0A4Y7RFK7_9FIRM|nr:FAD-dependent oxidoreductase [Pelotomaculum schinkii]TEB07563.1 NADH-dependent phenylglyoxylate dehydrogenase subunit epsilon [Pelotomaculum schinkii]
MRYLILGASATGLSAAGAIRQNDPWGDITVLSGDRHIYSRCLLPDVLAGRRDAAAARFVPEDFLRRNGVRWAGGVKAVKLLPEEKGVAADNGDKFFYDKLLIATGSSSYLPPVENINRGRQVYGLRNLEDVWDITRAAGNCRQAVIMGGGLVGVDAAVSLNEKGLAVVIVEIAGHILPLQLDQRAAASYEALFRNRGIEIITGEMMNRIILDDRQNVTGVQLKSGRVIPCGLVVAATGVRPNIDFLEGTPVEVGRGIKVNEYQETSYPDIYAAGDVCESLEVFTGKVAPTPIWPLAVLQGQVAGTNMAGGRRKIVNNFAFKNSMEFYGLNTVSFGFPEAPDTSYTTYIMESPGSYKKYIFKDGCLRGAILQGDISRAGVTGALIRKNTPVGVAPGKLFDLNYAYFFNQRENGEFVL